MGCNKCGCPTPRSQLCADCARHERFAEQARGQLDEADDEDDEDLLLYECTSCGSEYEAPDVSADCPECGSRRCRAVGKIEGVA